jgi:hypothetical protein
MIDKIKAGKEKKFSYTIRNKYIIDTIKNIKINIFFNIFEENSK